MQSLPTTERHRTNSDGSAGIITGDATAVGNAATNNVSQVVNVNAQGPLGSIVLVDQNAAVNNVGISLPTLA